MARSSSPGCALSRRPGPGLRPERAPRPTSPAPLHLHTEATMAPGTIYTCPMHPQIRRDAPGSCPICGMALEPLNPTAGEPGNPELRDMTRRFWIAMALAIPTFILEMGGHFPG